MCTNNGYNFVCICTSLMRRILQLLYLLDNSSRSRQNWQIRCFQTRGRAAPQHQLLRHSQKLTCNKMVTKFKISEQKAASFSKA